MENPDGAEIHHELQKDNPYWSFYIARFNAIGKEFYYEHFNTETINTEALGLRKLWYTQLPDILADNHGVPTHEYEGKKEVTEEKQAVSFIRQRPMLV